MVRNCITKIENRQQRCRNLNPYLRSPRAEVLKHASLKNPTEDQRENSFSSFPLCSWMFCCYRLHDEEHLDWCGGKNLFFPLLLLLLCPRKRDWAISRHTVLVKLWKRLLGGQLSFPPHLWWKSSVHQM